MPTGWANCACSTIYTDAWGRPVNGPGSGSNGDPTGQCAPNWGLLAMGAVVAVATIAVVSQHHRGARA